MLEPIGPLAEAVYWRRRGAAVGVLALALSLGLWGLTALANDDDSGARDSAGGPAGAPGSAANATTSSGAPSPTPSAGPTSSAAPSSAPPSSALAPPSGAPPSGASAAPPSASSDSCPDQSIGLTAQPAATEYGAGQPREFRMVVTNIGTSPCSRDLDPALQEVVVLTADGDRVWSSNDCYGAGAPAVRTLAPGEQLVFSVVWAGRTSQPGCVGQRESVPAGTYQLVAKLGSLASQAASFRIVG